MLIVSEVDRRDTHRLIPAQYADDGASVLARLTDDAEILNNIFELDNATNDRLWAESAGLPGIDVRELIFGISSYRIVNAAYCDASPSGSRFNSSDRGAWYAGFELKTSQAEVAYHRQLWLQETKWNKRDVADYADYLADFRAGFHELRNSPEYKDYLAPNSYAGSQSLAMELLRVGSAGVVYPSVRRSGGTNIACFRPVLVTNVRKSEVFTFEFPNSHSGFTVRRAAN